MKARCAESLLLISITTHRSRTHRRWAMTRRSHGRCNQPTSGRSWRYHGLVACAIVMSAGPLQYPRSARGSAVLLDPLSLTCELAYHRFWEARSRTETVFSTGCEIRTLWSDSLHRSRMKFPSATIGAIRNENCPEVSGCAGGSSSVWGLTIYREATLNRDHGYFLNITFFASLFTAK